MSRVNFNHDCMGATFSSSTDGGGVTGEGRSCQTNNPNGTTNINDTILALPKLSKNRYWREELLALFTGVDTPAPSRLKEDFSDFYLPTAQNPICMAPFSEIEQVGSGTFYVFSNMAHSGSIWIVVVLALEWYFAHTHPLRYLTWDTEGRAKIYLGTVSFLAVLYHIPRYFEVRYCRNSDM